MHGVWPLGGVQTRSPLPSQAWLAEPLPWAGFAPAHAGSSRAVSALALGSHTWQGTPGLLSLPSDLSAHHGVRLDLIFFRTLQRVRLKVFKGQFKGF